MCFLGDEIYAIVQNWGFNSIVTTRMSKSMMIGIYSKRYEYLEDPKGLDCKGDELKGQSNCVRETVRKAILDAGYECIPTHLKPFQINLKVLNYFVFFCICFNNIFYSFVKRDRKT